MLSIDHIHVGYGQVPVLHDITLYVNDGEFVAVLGPNGAGKTTLFNAISGIANVQRGNIRWNDQDLTVLPAAARAHLGIAHVPEGRQVFPSLSVIENLEMGAFSRESRNTWQQKLQQLYEWFPILSKRRSQAAGTLSGGEQQMLAIARGLASDPILLMLDEPSMGLSPAIADEIFERIVAIQKSSGIGVLLVEQRVAEALHFASRAYVLESGKVVLEGSHDTLKNDDRIRAAYLGM